MHTERGALESDRRDLRRPDAPVHVYDESHSDDVTALAFHPETDSHSGILLSGGMDGLVSAIDTTLSEEDDAVVSVGNTDSSVARIGWTKASGRYTPPRTEVADAEVEERDAALLSDPRRQRLGPLYAISNMQTLSMWDADRFDNLVPQVELRAPKCFKPSWATDYLIDASASYPVAMQDGFDIGVGMFVGDQRFVGLWRQS